MNIFKNLILSLFVIIFIASCEKDNSPKPVDEPETMSEEDSVYWFVHGLMHYWYFWNDELEVLEESEYLAYDEPMDLMEDMKVDQDNWSFVDKTQTVQQHFEAGVDFGYGFYLGWDNFQQLRVFMAYENTTAYGQGVRRGWILEKIDDVAVQDITNFDDFFSMDPGTMKFTFADDQNKQKVLTLNKEQFNLDAVFNPTIFDLDGKLTGYLAYQSFLGYSEDELMNALTYFEGNDIDELILDLRYNGGGYVSIAEDLANILAPVSSIGDVFYSVRHNDNVKNEQDTTVYFQTPEIQLDLNRLFVITNEYSASASELVQNGLAPHMDVIQIGQPTAGKPYAMYGFIFQDWLAYPVTAKSVNADGFGDYESGLVPDKFVTDYNSYDWGDENDPAVKQAINYILYGSFGNIALDYKSTSSAPALLNVGNSFKHNLLIMDK